MGQMSFMMWSALVLAVAGIALLVAFLLLRPALTRGTKGFLLVAIGLLPLGAGLAGGVAGFQRTMDREFCGSCHTMVPYAEDSADPNSTTLAAVHSRNKLFGDRNCYTCHANYGMFGTVVTKMSGMRHMYHYYSHYRSLPLEQALAEIEIYKPFPNGNCMQCHSASTPRWLGIQEHSSALEVITSGELSCASEGCHGPSHPFSKAARRAAEQAAGGQQ